ncbi:hypothetical protein C4D60_Mb03t08660 [Musa balbisiana]|uniref:Uncharacterized protein n=1 Tax=Musa balbisiana TaxID=52838 RepID=A0A4S8J8L2_MUSBA|nr:hypothetical protein C4D60_Mb03t08660 [Musa balbisiana]
MIEKAKLPSRFRGMGNEEPRHGKRRDEKSGVGCWTTGLSFKSKKKQGIRLDEHTTFLAMEEVLSATNSAQTCINNLSHSIKQSVGINKTKTIEVMANLQIPQSLHWSCAFSICRRIINIRSISFRNLIT